MFNNFVIIGDVKFVGIHWGLEGPSELVLPDRLHHSVLKIVELVGVAAGAVRGRHGVRLQQRPGVLVRALLLVPQLVVVSAEPPPAEPARVRLLTCKLFFNH